MYFRTLYNQVRVVLLMKLRKNEQSLFVNCSIFAFVDNIVDIPYQMSMRTSSLYLRCSIFSLSARFNFYCNSYLSKYISMYLSSMYGWMDVYTYVCIMCLSLIYLSNIFSLITLSDRMCNRTLESLKNSCKIKWTEQFEEF